MGEDNVKKEIQDQIPEKYIPEPESPGNPMRLLEIAINKDADVDKLERLMNLQERWERRQAEKAYTESMSKFQSECPVIIKNKDGGVTKSGQVAYKYAPIDRILETKDEDGKKVKELIAECGFSYDINTPEISEKGVFAVMTISHKIGYSKEFNIFMPFSERTNIMNQAQVVGATSSYAKRYVFLNGFGIMTGDEDSDGITDELWDKFYEQIKDWHDYGKQYLKEVGETIEKPSTFKKFLSSLPTEEHMKQFTDLSKKIPADKRKEYWHKFCKQNKHSADDFLTKLTEVLTQNKEKQNG